MTTIIKIKPRIKTAIPEIQTTPFLKDDLRNAKNINALRNKYYLNEKLIIQTAIAG